MGDAQEEECVFYFGYGSNMNGHNLRAKEIRTSVVGPAVLEGHRLAFSVYEAHLGMEPHFANLERPAQGDGRRFQHQVCGVLHRLPLSQVPALDRFEMNYGKQEVEVEVLATKEKVKALAYVCTDPVLLKEGPPSVRYHKILCDAAKESGLPAEYVAWLEGHETTPLNTLELTPELKASALARRFTDAELQGDGPKGDVVLTAANGVVFDISSVPRGVWVNKFFGGRDVTLFVARMVSHLPHPTTLADLQPGHKQYLDSLVADLAARYPVVGHTQHLAYFQGE